MKPKNTLKNRAKENTTVTRKVGRNEPETLKAGTPLDPTTKQSNENKRMSERRIAGISIGITKSLGDYQSLRVDAWLSIPIEEEANINQTYNEMHEIIGSVLEEIVSEYVPE